MSYLVGNHFVGFPTRRLKWFYFQIIGAQSREENAADNIGLKVAYHVILLFSFSLRTRE